MEKPAIPSRPFAPSEQQARKWLGEERLRRWIAEGSNETSGIAPPAIEDSVHELEFDGAYSSEAEGLADLGVWDDAWNVLESLPAEERSESTALRVRLRCCPDSTRVRLAEPWP